jgi:hypothetical protein
MKIFGSIIGSIILFVIVGFISVCIIAVGMDFYKSVAHGKGWVSQDKNGRAIKELIKEENGYVYYIDVWNTNGKTCGAYDLRMYP